MIIRSAGFLTSDLIGGRNAVNFAYILVPARPGGGDAPGRHRATGAPLVCHVRPCVAATPATRRPPSTSTSARSKPVALPPTPPRSSRTRFRTASGPACFRSSWTPRPPAAPTFFASRRPRPSSVTRASCPGHHCPRPAAQPQRRAPRLSQEASQGRTRPVPWAVQPDRQLRARPE